MATCTPSSQQELVNALRSANVDPSAIRSAHKQKSLKSDVKKATIFAKRMRTFEGSKDVKVVNADLDALNLGMFVAEAAQHIAGGLGAGGESKIKPDETFSLVEACSAIHQRYDKFQPELETKMEEALKGLMQSSNSLKEMSEPFGFTSPAAASNNNAGAPGSSSSSSGAAAASSSSSTNTSTELSSSAIAIQQLQEKTRVCVKVAAELVSVALLPPSIVVEAVLAPINEVLSKNAKFHHTSQTLSLLNLIVKYCGIEMCGGKIPGHPSLFQLVASVPEETKTTTTTTTTEESTTPATTSPSSPDQSRILITNRIESAKKRSAEKYSPDIGTPSLAAAEKSLSLFQTLSRSACALCKQFKGAVEKQWKALNERKELHGDDNDALQKFKRVKDEVLTLMSLTESLAKSIGDEESVPQPLDLSIEKKSADGAGTVVITSKMGDFYTVRDAEQQSRFDDDEQAQFYEGFPIIDDLIPKDQLEHPSTILTDEVMMEEEQEIPEALRGHYDEVDSHIETLQQSCVATSYTDAWIVTFLKMAGKLYPLTSFLNPQAVVIGTSSSDNNNNNNNNDDSNNNIINQSEHNDRPKSTPIHIAKVFFTNCRRRLMSELRYVRGNALEMIPFYARVVASLARIFKDVGEWLTLKFENDTFYLVQNVVQNAASRRLRNARFLCELTKFRVAPPVRSLRLMTKLVEDLDKETVNVEVLANFFDQVGPFLARGGVTAEKLTKIVADTKSRISSLSNISEHLLETLNAGIVKIARANKPRPAGGAAAVAVKVKIRSPLEEYLRHLLFKELEPHRSSFVVDQVLKFPWVLNTTSPNLRPEVKKQQADNLRMMISVLRDAGSCRWDRLYLLARVCAKVAPEHPTVILTLLDMLFEDIRTDLEYPQSRTQQARLQDLKFLGELFVQRLVPTIVILYVLAQLVLYFPHDDEKTKLGQKFRMDYSRVRGVCTLLEASQFAAFCEEGQGISSRTLHLAKKILLHFFRLVHMKDVPLPHDLDFKLAELIATLQQSLNKPITASNAPAFLVKLFFKLEFPKTFKDAEALVAQHGKWNANDGFEKLLHQFEQLSVQTAKTNPGFVSYSTCTNTTVPSSFPKGPWMAPIIDGVFEAGSNNNNSNNLQSGNVSSHSSSSSSTNNSVSNVITSELLMLNNNNQSGNKNKIISQDAKAAGDYDEDEDIAATVLPESSSSSDDDDDENDKSSSSSSESEDEEEIMHNKNSKNKAETALLEDKQSGAFSRWARQAASQKQRAEAAARKQAALNNGDDDGGSGSKNKHLLDNPSGMDASGTGSFEEQQNALDEILYNMLSESTKERTSTANAARTDKNVEERLGKVQGFTMKQKSATTTTTTAASASQQQQNNLNNLISSLASSTSNHQSITSTTTSCGSTSSARKKSPSMKMSFLRRTVQGSVEAKPVLVPTDSDIALASQSASEEREKEKRDLVQTTIRLVKNADTNVDSTVGGGDNNNTNNNNQQQQQQKSSGPPGSNTTTGAKKNISKHQVLNRKSAGDEETSADSGLNLGELKASVRQPKK